ncbi:MAG TPA: hypothetical protein VH164_09310 [Ktedonobacteraceae bacterium]|nr:hypothetical protein [Ktedonobacteraceae bacterium]
MNYVTVVVHRAALLIHLRANHVGLIIHLIARIGSVVLVIPQIDALIPTVPLIKTYIGRAIPAVTATTVSSDELIILLISYRFALTANLVSAVDGVVLRKSMIHALISVVTFVATHKKGPISAVANTMKALVILLAVGRG